MGSKNLQRQLLIFIKNPGKRCSDFPKKNAQRLQSSTQVAAHWGAVRWVVEPLQVLDAELHVIHCTAKVRLALLLWDVQATIHGNYVAKTTE